MVAGLYYKHQRSLFILFAVVLIVGFYGLFFFIPLFTGVTGSFFHWNPLAGERTFAGLKNYQRLFSSPVFQTSLKNTTFFTVTVVLGKGVLGLLLALAIDSMRRTRSFFRSLYFLPVITPIVAISIVWKWFYHPRVGLLNMILALFGDGGANWLGDPKLAMPAVIIMTIWKEVGYAIVIFMAALLGIPRTLYEAAQIDGVNRVQNFFYITLPTIKPTVMFIVITSLISDFQSFVQIFIMTKGGPGTATHVLSYLIYNEAFVNYKYGYASAISVVLFLIIMAVTLAQVKLLSKGE